MFYLIAIVYFCSFSEFDAGIMFKTRWEICNKTQVMEICVGADCSVFVDGIGAEDFRAVVFLEAL